MKERKKKKRIRFKGLVIVLLLAYIFLSFLYFLWKNPIKKIEITGNYYLKDNYLIDYLDISKESIIKVSSRSIIKKLKKLELISDAKVHKNYLGTLKIEVVEDKILFYNWNNKKMILSSGKEIEYNSDYLGVPNLINYVPDEVYEEFIKKLNIVEREVLTIVSEIEYSPSIINDKIVDNKRFLFRMNDGNIVYINTTNIEKFNSYLDIYESIVNKNGPIKGCLYLDSNSENKHFNKCSEIEKEEVENTEETETEN